MKPAIQCKYSCAACGIKKRTVTVAQREYENVVEWLETVCAPAIAADHYSQSPRCPATKMTELMIPVPEGTEKIGTLP